MSDRPTAADRFRTAQTRLLVASGAQATSRLLRVRDGYAHVLEAGAGRPVLLLHGLGGVAATWSPLLAELQTAFHLVAADLPGCGLSDLLRSRDEHFRDRAAGFVAACLDALGLSRAGIVGSSLGGYCALAFALAQPERVRRLALVGAPAGIAPWPPLRHRLLAAPGLGRLVGTVAPGASRGRLRRQLGRGPVLHPERLSELMLDVIHAAATLPGARRAQRAMVRSATSWWAPSRLTHALRGELGELDTPTRLV